MMLGRKGLTVPLQPLFWFDMRTVAVEWTWTTQPALNSSLFSMKRLGVFIATDPPDGM